MYWKRALADVIKSRTLRRDHCGHSEWDLKWQVSYVSHTEVRQRGEMMEAEIGAMWLLVRECRPPPEAGEGKKQNLLEGPEEGAALMTPWLQASLERVDFCCFKPPASWKCVKESLGNNTEFNSTFLVSAYSCSWLFPHVCGTFVLWALGLRQSFVQTGLRTCPFKKGVHLIIPETWGASLALTD